MTDTRDLLIIANEVSTYLKQGHLFHDALRQVCDRYRIPLSRALAAQVGGILGGRPKKRSRKKREKKIAKKAKLPEYIRVDMHRTALERGDHLLKE